VELHALTLATPVTQDVVLKVHLPGVFAVKHLEAVYILKNLL
jgi:hypothetical protein